MKNFRVAALVILALATWGAKLQGATPRKVVLEPLEMRYGDTVRTGIPFAKDPTVIRLGKKYYMY